MKLSEDYPYPSAKGKQLRKPLRGDPSKAQGEGTL